MGELLCVGLSEYPYFRFKDDRLLTQSLRDRLADLKDVAPKDVWPSQMVAEWATDEGAGAARRHRDNVLAGMRQLRTVLDRFGPDVVVVLSEDHYESYRETLMPLWAVNASDAHLVRPFVLPNDDSHRENIWRVPHDFEYAVSGAQRFAAEMVSRLARLGFELPVTFEHGPANALAHTFAGVLTYLDLDHEGWPYPVVPLFINNAGGSDLARNSSEARVPADVLELMPRPTTARCWDLGGEIASMVRDQQIRVALIAGSSWSHANLNSTANYLYPDAPGDREIFNQLREGEFAKIARLDLDDLVPYGRQELLNWFPLFGAVERASLKPVYLEFHAGYVCNSNKVLAAFQ